MNGIKRSSTMRTIKEMQEEIKVLKEELTEFLEPSKLAEEKRLCGWIDDLYGRIDDLEGEEQ
jgi:hypothetical protein